jgi:hypothetical protein
MILLFKFFLTLLKRAYYLFVSGILPLQKLVYMHEEILFILGVGVVIGNLIYNRCLTLFFSWEYLRV